MDLSEKQKKILEGSLFSKWFDNGPKCPICQQTVWEVSPIISELPQFQSKRGLDAPKQVFPVIIVVCATCSYCATFSAVKLGLLTDGSPSSQTDDANRGSTQ